MIILKQNKYNIELTGLFFYFFFLILSKTMNVLVSNELCVCVYFKYFNIQHQMWFILVCESNLCQK